jgi:hypothetical protein
MNQVIIYTQDNGTLAIIIPTEEALAIYGLDAIAKKDVPSGKPYKIILDTEVPTDRMQRTQWTVADTDLTDGVGAVSNEFPVT